jgi:uncharacterized protein (TIGR03118 family)
VKHTLRRLGAVLAFALLVVAIASGAASSAGGGYTVTNLVSDQAGHATHVDTSLVNAWGLAALPASPWWVADNGANVSTLYNASGDKVPLTVAVSDSPTGLVANAGGDFVVSNGGTSGPSLFMFSSESGRIDGWNPTVSGNSAIVAVDRSGAGAIYKGLAIAKTSQGMRLYATDFHNGRVDVFDGHFRPVETPGAFVDRDIPAGYAPFGIQAIGGSILVTYAQQDADRHDDVPGPGHGFVDMYDTSGKLLQRVATRGTLDSPWGLAWAPSGFGPFAGDLLVGDFGDGRINAFQQHDGTFSFAGQLQSNGEPITIDGLWSLQFGHGEPANGSTGTLFFTAGPDHESHGLFGTITAG